MSVATDSDAPLGANAFTFLDKSEYFRDLISCIAKTKSGDRVLVATMVFDLSEPLIAELMDALCAAAKRGVETSLAIDVRVFMVKRRSSSTQPAIPARTTMEALEKLQNLGGMYAVTNRPDQTLNNPFGGRSHIKTAIINNTVYVGGCNLTDATDIDMMVRFQNDTTADWLYQQMRDVVRKQSTRLAFAGKDLELALDNDSKLLIDSGKRKQSIIFEHALALIDAAEDWIVITCQFFPNSVTAKHLAMAYKRGVKVSIYYNHPSKHRAPHNILHHLVILHERTRQPSVLFKEQLRKDLPFLHAKLIATDKGAIIGSHNYVTAGVNFGTAEIALLRYDPAFSRYALQAFMQQLTAKT